MIDHVKGLCQLKGAYCFHGKFHVDSKEKMIYFFKRLQLPE